MDDDPKFIALPPAPGRGEMLALIGRIRQWVLNKLDKVQAGFVVVDGRLDALEQTPAVTLTVVATSAGLPQSAGPRQFFRVQGDTALYIGNGPGNPLGRIVPA